MEIKLGRDMKIRYCIDYEEMSLMASNSVISDLKANSIRFVCVATGNSPTGTYSRLEKIYNVHPEYFKELSIVKLDEWGGLNDNDPNSCEYYIRHKILRPLHIAENQYVSFKSDAADSQVECDRVQSQIDALGPIDICILGLGKNGHIGFIEPSELLSIGCHVGQLSSSSKNHQMVEKMRFKPDYGLTLGLGDLFRSKKIILLVTGENKEKIIEKLLSKKITTQLPASLLWLHGNVECYIDSESLV